MKRGDRMMIRTLLALALVLILSLGGAASGAPRNLPEGFVIGDAEGLQVDDHGAYYIHEKNLRPGDTIHKRIVIRNTHNEQPYALTLTSVPMERKGPIDLLDRVRMVMKLDGAVIYEGRLYGDAGGDMVKNPLDLGTYRYLDESILDIQLTFDRDIPSELLTVPSTAEVGWIFRATKSEGDKPIDPRPVGPVETLPQPRPGETSLPGMSPVPGGPVASRSPAPATPQPRFPFLPRTGDGSHLSLMIAILLASVVVAEWIVYQRYKRRMPRK